MNTVLPVFSSNWNSWEILRFVEFCKERKKKIRSDGARIPMHLAYSTSGLSFYSPTVLPYKITSRCGAQTTPDEDNGIWPLLSAFLCHHFYLTWFSDPLSTAPSVLPLAIYTDCIFPFLIELCFLTDELSFLLNPVCFFDNFFFFSCL